MLFASLSNMDQELKYLEAIGLHYNPFPVTPTSEAFYLSEEMDRIVTELVHGVVTRKGFMLLTGEVGLGKSTIARKVIDVLDKKGVRTSFVFQTLCHGYDLMREINRDFGVVEESASLSDQVAALNRFLLEENRQGINCAIIIDDAQNLNKESLELVRMISNLETNRQKLVQVLLIGQPELVNILDMPDLRQLKSRIVITEKARPLTREELSNYILFKLNMAGNNGRIILKRGAVRGIHKITGGNLRKINLLMERALYALFMGETNAITRRIILEAKDDLNLQPQRTLQPQWGRTWGWAVVGVICIIAGAPLFWGSSSFTCMSGKQEAPSLVANEIKNAFPLKKKVPVETIPAKALPAQDKKPASALPLKSNEVADFLKSYALSEFEDEFVKALKDGRIADIADIVFEKKKLRLLQLKTVPSQAKGKYGLLKYRLKQDKKEEDRFLLFWKPLFAVDKFYYHYQGDEIRKLQELLKRVDLYDYVIDGVVGHRLMKGVVEFQRKNGMEVTGVPNDETIFFLYCQEPLKKPVLSG
ncbi:MAG: AAA family ATPase [Pseudomonadota bacterium]